MDILSNTLWTEWTPFSAVSWKAIPTGPGTYMIGAHRALHRAVGIDEQGILDIGQSKFLRRRLRTFWQCANAESAIGHMAGWRFQKYKMARHFPLGKLHVCWRHFGTAAEAIVEEARLIEAYVHQHMESPPLNYAASWRHLNETEDELIDA